LDESLKLRIWIAAKESERAKARKDVGPGQVGRTIATRRLTRIRAAEVRPHRAKVQDLTRLLGGRGASAVMGFVLLSVGSSGAAAQTAPAFDIKAAVKAVEAGASSAVPATAKISALYSTPAKPTVTVALPPANPVAALAAKASLPVATSGPSIAREAAWLHQNGWGLHALVGRYSASAQIENEEENCMAVAVYHEARGEDLEGQLAVARVIMNRASSGKYPATWCGVVKQPWQFSFVNPRTGLYPSINEQSAAWAKAKAITKLAVNNSVPSLSNDVLWYHADYVAPSWGRRLSRVQKIGTHIFYRA
jgi:spore germination cell wall hydrolase CwlJ-like protein